MNTLVLILQVEKNIKPCTCLIYFFNKNRKTLLKGCLNFQHQSAAQCNNEINHDKHYL